MTLGYNRTEFCEILNARYTKSTATVAHSARVSALGKPQKTEAAGEGLEDTKVQVH
jgi:hypothetical protein